jgi:hypothetical protein
MMVQAPDEGRYWGLSPNTSYWLARMARYSKVESRWVDKGPIMLYFLEDNSAPRLVANYLYGLHVN